MFRQTVGSAQRPNAGDELLDHLDADQLILAYVLDGVAAVLANLELLV